MVKFRKTPNQKSWLRQCFCPHGAQQQASRTPRQRSNDETDGQTDGRTLDRFVDPALHTTRSVPIMHALMKTKVDYCSSVLSGISGQLLQRLQCVSVFNAAARLVFSARKSEHITPLLRELHWLKVPERIQFRLCVLAYRCLIGTAPSYLTESFHVL